MTEALIPIVKVAAPAGSGPARVAPERGTPPVEAAATAAPGPQEARPEVGVAAVAEAAEALQRYANEAGAELSFRVDAELGRVVVTLLDRRDGSVLRQIPSEEAIRIARMIGNPQAQLMEGVA